MIFSDPIRRCRDAYCGEVDRVVSALLTAFNTPGGVVELHDVEWISAEIRVLQNMLDILQRRLDCIFHAFVRGADGTYRIRS
jgi:hypothetical protein